MNIILRGYTEKDLPVLPYIVSDLNCLRFVLSIFSGNYFNICKEENPAGFSSLLFHGKGRNGKQSPLNQSLMAGKLDSFSQSLAALPAPSRREPLAKRKTFPYCQGFSLWESCRANARLRGFMPFPSTPLPVKKRIRNDRSRFGFTNIKIIFPLILSERSGGHSKT